MIRILPILLLTLLPFGPSYAQNAAPPLITAQPVPHPAPSVPPPVVLELFTSQGCAFCPPADELMGRMIQQQNIIGLSCHVDYFTVRKNNLGKSFCTKRQGDYNRQIGTGPRYTPQLVVNGHMDMIGYETGKVSAAVMKARSEKIGAIQMAEAGADAYSFTLPAIQKGADPITLWMAVFDAPHSMAMTEGNNLGKMLTYYNVVTRMVDLGPWDGTPMARAINAEYQPGNGGVAIIAQNARTGHIVAAGSVRRAPNIAAVTSSAY